MFDLLSLCGPVIAIGRPGEATPPLGAFRFWVHNDNWKKVVEQLLEEARYVVMVMGKLSSPIPSTGPEANRRFDAQEGDLAAAEVPIQGEGLTWEVNRLFALKDLSKVILVMPPIPENEALPRWGRYVELSHGRLSPYRGGEIAATFTADGVCKVVRANATGWFAKSYRRDLDAYRQSFFVG